MSTHDGAQATNDDDPTVIIAGTQPENWQAVCARLHEYITLLSSGQLTLCENTESRGIIGPQVDGCVRVDIELFLVPATVPAISNPHHP
jgi:hypothetical protein